ncbi:MAG: hypothetical protein ABJN14_02605 [Paracoccaceae bacterium]
MSGFIEGTNAILSAKRLAQLSMDCKAGKWGTHRRRLSPPNLRAVSHILVSHLVL